MEETVFLWGVFFGLFGMSFFIYGKKQDKIIPLISGIILMVFPYFIENLYITIAVGVGLIILPFVVKI
ncbi:MAG: hypothetical protein PHI79_05395 [Sulfurovaceae bacterium]|jgi:hypothetical protein|nr:hypothetical protein [Sulfurovaceae bacterium]MDD5549011.1 hypothetical protein [Sulfurovaceae bacterium]